VVEPTTVVAEETDEPALGPGETAVRAEVTGSVWQVAAEPGQRVKAGDQLVVLETMKMETPLVAPQDGAVRLIRVERGGLVTAGQVVMALEPAA
jgi:urea carboxylase